MLCFLIIGEIPIHLQIWKSCGLYCHNSGLQTPFTDLLQDLNINVPENTKYNVLSGAGTIIQNTSSNWADICGKFYNRNFLNLKQVIRYPINKSSKFHEIETTFEQWIGTGPGFVITNYSTEEHCKFLAYDFIDIHKKLHINVGGTFSNRLLVGNSKHKVILNVRVLETNDLERIDRELSRSCDDIHILMSMNKEIFAYSGIILVGIVVANDIPSFENFNNDFLFCGPNCESLIVFKKDLLSAYNFESCWNEHIYPALRDIRLEFKEETNCSAYEEMIVVLLGRILGFLAAHPIRGLPTLSDDVENQLKTVVLTMEQMRVLDSVEKKIIVKGGYGSGKTVLALLKLKQLADNASETTVIYYVNCEDKSLLTSKIKEDTNCQYDTCVEVLTLSIEEVRDKFSLPKTIELSRIFTSALKYHSDAQVHFIFDEFDLEHLNDDEAKSLRNIFDEDDKVKNSVVMVMAQPLEKTAQVC